MDKRRIKQIINLNKKFYQQVGKKFAQTYSRPWKGWGRVIKHLPTSNIKALDLGCGDGRFYKYLSKELPNIKYTGLDTNNDVLNVARKKHPKAKFFELDILSDLSEIKEKFDLVLAFGITHHIPDEDFRKRWFFTLPQLLKKGGLLVLTFWVFEKEPGDYLVSWGNRKDAKRFCHQYSKKELKKIIRRYEKENLKLLDRFTADNTNEYLVFYKH